MYSFDIILIVLLSLYTIMITIKLLSLRQVNESFEILQKHKPSRNQMIDLINQKFPTVITGEVEEWFIFDETDKIVEEKLNTQTLNENTNNLSYLMPLVRKYEIQDYQPKYQSQIITQKNTRNFIVLLQGAISVYLLNPNQKSEVEKNRNLTNNSELKYTEVKLYAEQILHIPYQWHYSFKCQENTKLLDVNSETILTLPIKIVMDKL